jgi:hypothetical protein
MEAQLLSVILDTGRHKIQLFDNSSTRFAIVILWVLHYRKEARLADILGQEMKMRSQGWQKQATKLPSVIFQ